MSSEEPKVTKCCTDPDKRGYPVPYEANGTYGQPAVLLWLSDYEAMRKELEELRGHKKISEAVRVMPPMVLSSGTKYGEE